MAEDYLVKEPLTDTMVEIGAAVAQKLLDSGFPLRAAFWLWDPDVRDDWRLVIAAPDEALHGPDRYTPIYAAVDSVGEKAKEILNMALLPMESESKWVAAIITEYPTGSHIVRKRVRKHVLGGKFIHDALLYWAA